MAPAVRAQQQPSPQQAFLSFEYADGLVQDIVTARYDNSQFYISLTEVFDLLQIDYRIDFKRRRIFGFYIDQERQYEIDLANQTAQIDGQTFTFSASDFILTKLDVFLRPNVFSKLFDLNFTASLRQLQLSLETSQIMPVEQQARRQLARSDLEEGILLEEPDAPLLAGREFRYIDGGVLDYTFGTNISASGARGRLSMQFGGALLGGDIEGRLRGTFSERGIDMRFSSGEWRWVFDKPYLTQVLGGWLSSSGLRTMRYRGIRITNNPVGILRMYGTYYVEGQTEPQWEVELYVNDQLVDYARADAQGRYFFEVPLSYGSTQITIREYGPSGQYREDERRVQVPFTFVPDGKIFYAIEAGQSVSPSVKMVQSHASIGLTNWLTNKTGVDFVLNHPGYGQPILRPYNTVSARLGSSYILSLHAAPYVSYKATLDVNYPSRASLHLSYGYNYRDEVFNRLDRQEEIEVRGSLPIDILHLSLYLRFSGSRWKISNSRYTYRLRPSATIRFGGSGRLSLDYLGRFNRSDGVWQNSDGSLDADLSYILPFFDGLLTPLNRLRFSLRAEYEFREDRLQSVEFDISRRLFDIGHLRISVTRNLISDVTYGRFRLTMNLPFVRSSTSGNIRRGDVTISQDVNGSVAFDTRYNRMQFSRRGWTGRAGAVIRMFVDANGNGAFDTGEQTIEEGDVRFRQATSTDQTEAGLIRATNLQPYTRYNVSVDLTSIQNPLWIPKKPEFSFIARPNSFTPVDVPFYVAGVLSGSVLKSVDGRKEPVPGLDMIVRGVETDYRKKIDVFNQGSFYYYKLPPGKYVLFVDSTQQEILQVRSEPAARYFTVEPTEHGDFISGMDFVLYPKSPKCRDTMHRVPCASR